jgi:RNA polymerase sigma-70 factor (ECF subfamily)
VTRPDPDFAGVYEEHVWQVYGFLAYRVRAREEAEDLTQLTFERALRAWGRYDQSRSALSTWLLTIARNLLIDRYRSDASAPTAEPLHDVAEHRLPDAHASPWIGLRPELERALAGLDQRSREIIALRFGADLTGPEIAAVTGLSLANVQQILSRALRRLRSDLGDGDAEEHRAADRQRGDPGSQ